jgi:RNA polymerase sigma-70 factor (ECF subfamily)
MASGQPMTPADLERYRGYLRRLARQQLEAVRGRQTIEVSDVVQDALLRAHRSIDQFRGRNEQEFAGWLRSILSNALADVIRKHTALKRDVALERSLNAALDESSAHMEQWLAADQPSPSDEAMTGERLLRLAEALDELPADQRRAVTLHHLERQSLAQVADCMDRSLASAAGLIRRGMVALRQRLESTE